jgi:hypothetical protein
MAGSWPDAPAARVAYQTGSAGLWWQGAGALQPVPQGQLGGLNSYAADPTGRVVFDDLSPSVWVLFDVPHDLRGWFLAGRSSGGQPTVTVATSTDTTSGTDGVWVTKQTGVAVNADGSASMQDVFREPTSVSSDQVRGVRFDLTYTGSAPLLSALHVYADVRGEVESQRLQVWAPDADEPAAPALLDWGNARRGSSASRSFRVKNCSASLTARSVIVSTGMVDVDEPGTGPPVPTQFLLTVTGQLWRPSMLLGDLAPDSISPNVGIRRVTPSDAALGTFDPFVRAIPAGWSED